jgi:hypothetical protein
MNTVPQMKREDLIVDKARCFLIHNLLSAEECQFCILHLYLNYNTRILLTLLYIREAESLGFEDMTLTFPEEYRSNDRVLVLSTELANLLW